MQPDPVLDPERLDHLRAHAERLRRRLGAANGQAGELLDQHGRLSAALAEAEDDAGAVSVPMPMHVQPGPAESAWGLPQPPGYLATRAAIEAERAGADAANEAMRRDAARLAAETTGLRAEAASLSAPAGATR